jgi:hypothetical protein
MTLATPKAGAEHELLLNKPLQIFPFIILKNRLLTPVYTNSGTSDFCHVRPILPGCLSNFARLSDQYWDMNLPISPSDFVQFNFLVHRFIESFIWNFWLTIGHELHKIGWRDMNIPISKIGRRAWQNQTDNKNLTDFGCSCKQAVNGMYCLPCLSA